MTGHGGRIAIVRRAYPEGMSDAASAVSDGGIGIVRADLTVAVEVRADNAGILSEVELRRAGEYYYDRDRIRFIRRRITLRRLLAEILGYEPKEIAIRTEESGKPFVAAGDAIRPLSFSMSSSKDRAIYAFALGREVGIDIEWMDPTMDFLEIAATFCHRSEIERLKKMPDQDRIKSFYDCWCSKEAFIKAAGIRDPRSFAVSVRPDPPGLISTLGDIIPSKWSFHRLYDDPWSVVLVEEVLSQKKGQSPRRAIGPEGIQSRDPIRVLAP